MNSVYFLNCQLMCVHGLGIFFLSDLSQSKNMLDVLVSQLYGEPRPTVVIVSS